MSSNVSTTAGTVSSPRKTPRIVVLGGGSVGLYSARRIRKRLGKKDAAIVVVDPRPYMTYAPFLPEVAAGSIDGRNVVAPLRSALKGVDVLQGKVTAIKHGEHKVEITPEIGDAYEISYDELVVSLGSVSRTLPIPGLAEQAIGFKNVEEAVSVRNHVVHQLDLASSCWDADERRRMLTFTFIGGGFAGIEALAEVEDMARAALSQYESIDQADLRFVMIEGAGRILPELSEPMAEYALEQLKERGIEFHLSTFLSSCVDGHVVTSTGVEFDSNTIVWTAGVKANPVIGESDLPTDKMGRLTVNANLQVVDEDGVVVPAAWGAGDCAAVPDLLNPGAFCPPNAQHAIRQATQLGDNLVASVEDRPLVQYKHKSVGVVASLGLYKGVAELFGVFKFKGFPAWAVHRTYHGYAMPTWNRKIRIFMGWFDQFVMRRKTVSLGSIHDPRAAFRNASLPPKPKDDAAPKSDKDAVGAGK
ncbi:NAD(P)/FAD-dependent oxidoreductase [Paraoerskovia marina]|uniref:NADH dehydrogenase n=1 Tax=Paraoerskovia marina TaxID=545619 RepID=A0A1H1QIU9_9CELL|nr:NAD(P)/FAD-dependent oxidoreductase [Paraoerskovia marina]SDS23412.1 NADH dehydrogenase [Paraoerskovia marina]